MSQQPLTNPVSVPVVCKYDTKRIRRNAKQSQEALWPPGTRVNTEILPSDIVVTTKVYGYHNDPVMPVVSTLNGFQMASDDKTGHAGLLQAARAIDAIGKDTTKDNLLESAKMAIEIRRILRGHITPVGTALTAGNSDQYERVTVETSGIVSLVADEDIHVGAQVMYDFPCIQQLQKRAIGPRDDFKGCKSKFPFLFMHKMPSKNRPPGCQNDRVQMVVREVPRCPADMDPRVYVEQYKKLMETGLLMGKCIMGASAGNLATIQLFNTPYVPCC